MTERPETIFARAVRDAVTARAMTYQNLVDLLVPHGLHLHDSTISKMLTDARGISLGEAVAIAAVLDLRLDPLIPANAEEDR